ncbi:MAG: GMP synthase [Rhodobacterales bacterium 65-51]|uniref:type 1 glutamine amidotransferase n=1 Tax=uncultured Gemmobacter sp. TaxID=1095917 RepID=UPI00096399BB|nr:type 1 glutamine amidotransferase [uncultured Gemmobacter sp.]OJY26254.1 MAG: GMP synthase [Rhodobacterales bacterium 65-51]
MRVAIVENTKVTHHGQVGVALHEAAARIGLYKPWVDGQLPDPADYDALVVFGGEQHARADDSHPYLPELARRMRAFSGADRAVLGICLGSQLLARGFGAENRIGTAPEFGWCSVELTPEGTADPVLGCLPERFISFQWHSDTFTLPEGALHLARSAGATQQAFRLGRATYATQFHFEAHRGVVADWARGFPAVMEGMSPGWLDRHPQEAARVGVEADLNGLMLARAFVARI